MLGQQERTNVQILGGYMEGYAITRGRLSRYRLFWTKNIYDRQGAEQMFFSAFRENCAYHYRHCREYRKILKRSGFRPGHLKAAGI